MGKTRAKQRKGTKKLQVSKEFCTCSVVLHDIALDKNLISLYQFNLSKKKDKELEQFNLSKKKDKELEQSSSCINKHKDSYNIQLKENVKKKSSTRNKKRRTKRECSQKINRKIQEKYNKVESWLSNENIQTDQSTSLNYQYGEIIRPKVTMQRIACSSNAQAFSSKDNDQVSNISSCSYSEEMLISTNNKTHYSIKKSNVKEKNKFSYKRELDFNEPDDIYMDKADSDNTDYSNKKNLISIDYDSQMQETSSDFTALMQCNMHSVDTIDEINYQLQRKQNHNSKDINRESTKVGLNDINCSNKKDITFIDYDSEMQESSDIQMQYNIHSIGRDKRNYELQQKQNRKRKSSKNEISLNARSKGIKRNISSESVNSSDTSSILFNKMSERLDTKTKSTNSITSSTTDNTVQATNDLESLSSDLNPICTKSTSKANNVIMTLSNLKAHNEQKLTSNKIIAKRELPRITKNNVLPQGTVKILKINEANNSLQNNVPEQNRYNSNVRGMKTFHLNDAMESTNILKRKGHCTSLEINGLINSSNAPKFTLSSNNNINLKTEDASNTGLCDKITNCKDLTILLKKLNNNVSIDDVNNDNKTSRSHNKYTIDQLQATKFADSNKMHKINSFQDSRQCKEISYNKDIPNIDASDDKRNNDNSNALISINEEDIRQNRKRNAERNLTDVTPNNKKVKLNRDSWLQNTTTFIKSKRRLDNNSNENVTLNSKMSEDKEHSKIITDLRECLDKKRLKVKDQVIYKSKSTFEDNRNKTSEMYKQTDLNDKNNGITTTNMQANGSDKELSVKEHFNGIFEEKNNAQLNSVYNNFLHPQDVLIKMENVNLNKNANKDTKDKKDIAKIGKKHTDNIINNKDDDDCISLFANESFDVTLFEESFSCEDETRLDKSEKSKNIETPYVMSNSSIDKFIKQNTNEFNKQYAEYIGNSVNTSKEPNETRESNNQLEQNLCTNIFTTAIDIKTRHIEIQSDEMNINKIFIGYCFAKLRRNTCNKENCRYKHDLQHLVNCVNSGRSILIIKIIQYALNCGYNFVADIIYVASLEKLTVHQILATYQTFQDVRNSITHSIVKELLNRQLSLKMIVDNLVAYSLRKNLQNLKNVLLTYIQPGEYWSTMKTLILELQPNIYIIHKILHECIQNKESINVETVQDINDNLLNKLCPTAISSLDKNIMKCFKSLLIEKAAEDPHLTVSTQDFGENLELAEIASPDSNQSLSLTEESPRGHSNSIYDNTNDIKNNVTQEVNSNTLQSYTLQHIDDLPDARSIYREHENLWKFYVDLDRFKKGLLHKDYDYVINILKSYLEKQDENALFFRSCRNILQTEVKRSEYHLANIIRRTVQMGSFNILSKILFDMTSDVLINLMDQEAWVLASWLIQLINTYDLPYNAEFFLLSAGIYLADEKAIEAYDLLKNKNIIYNSRAKWYVKSTINDEYARNKIMHILLDTLCKKYVEHAIYLFKFLLKDQSNQYFPIDLSRYMDKLIILSLLQTDMNIIMEMGSLVIKYNFALRTITCRALVSTLVHIDEVLAKQLYNYAEGIGIYSEIKVWPVTYVIINTELTEEEIYLTCSQLLKNLLLSFGHTIEFAKPYQIKAYIILEIKLKTSPSYYAELQSNYSSQIILKKKTLIRHVLQKRFDPPMLLTSHVRSRICRIQSTSIINYLKSEHL